jgi:hypothetical protein
MHDHFNDLAGYAMLAGERPALDEPGSGVRP